MADQDTEQRFNNIEQILSALQQQNSQVVGLLSNLSRPAERKEEPLPEITGTEFLEKPTAVIDNVVGRQVGKLKEDLDNQLRPFAEFMMSTQRTKLADDYISQMESNSATYPHIGNPLVRRIVKESIVSAPNVNPQFVHAVYLTAVGQAFSSGQLGAAGSKEESKEEQKKDKSVPAHLRPTPPSSGGAIEDTLPELTEDEKSMGRRRGWTHARTCYMFRKITPEVYKRLEPSGKLVDFGD